MIPTILTSDAELEGRRFMASVYSWMSFGLALTGGVAWTMSSQPELVMPLLQNPLLFYGLLGAELLLVFYLSRWMSSLNAFSATVAFTTYAAISGITFSVVFLRYTQASIASTFVVTAGTFAVMSVYGYATKTDLTSVGNFCLMALIGLIIASVTNLFLHNTAIYWITTYVGILIFVALTAYDTQKIKQMNVGGNDDRRIAISGALALYLDFVNIFLSLLRIMGRRR